MPAREKTLSLPVAAATLSLLLATGCVSRADADYASPATRAEVQRMVATEAVRMRVPVPLALAVAHAESNFDPAARSHRDARGVMQIMPATAQGEYGIAPHQLWNARINIRLGLHFLRRLLDRYDGRVELALSYYNGGSAVGDLPHARVIPATAGYVARVKRLRGYYRQLLLQGTV